MAKRWVYKIPCGDRSSLLPRVILKLLLWRPTASSLRRVPGNPGWFSLSMVPSPDFSDFTNLRGVKTCATAAEKTRKYCTFVDI